MFIERRLVRFILIAALIGMSALSLSSCNNYDSEKSGSLPPYSVKNLLDDYQSIEILKITNQIEFGKSKTAGFLISGAVNKSNNGQTGAPAGARHFEQKFRFLALSGRLLKINLFFKISTPGNQTNSIRLFINEKAVSEFTITQTKSWYSTVIPQELIKNGFNEAVLDMTSVSSAGPGQSAKLRSAPSVSLTKVRFAGVINSVADIELTDGKIRQPLGTFFNTYEKLPGDCLLSFKIGNLDENRLGIVAIATDGHKSKTVLIRKNGHHEVNLSDIGNSYARLSFQIKQAGALDNKNRGTEKQFIEWSEMKLHMRPLKSEASGPPDNQGPSDGITRLSAQNVIYIIFDAFHAGHSNLYGYSRKTTPFLEELAKESVLLENMFANAPYTLASTGSLFTSLYPYEHGLNTRYDRITPHLPTINEILSDNDIETYLITNHPYFNMDIGLKRGFSSNLYGLKKYNRKPRQVIRTLDKIFAATPDKRRFIYLHLIPPHVPYLPPKEFRVFPGSENPLIKPTAKTLHDINTGKIKIDKKQLSSIIASYDANLRYADDFAQKIVKSLKKNKVLDKSVLIITSDHGEAFRQHGSMGHNTTVFDEMIHIPFIMRLPEGSNVKSKRVKGLASLIDIPPTLLDVFGIQGEYGFRGKSLFPLIFKDAALHDYVYAETLLTKHRTLRDLNYKYIISPRRELFFDLHKDPKEKTNIIYEFSITAGYYRQLMHPMLAAKYVKTEGSGEANLKKLKKSEIERLKNLGYLN